MDTLTKNYGAAGTGLSVIVVGAGPAGLAAGYRLKKAGVHVIVLDQGSEVGGKIKTRHINGFHLDLGPTIVPPAHTRMIELVHELGIQDKLETTGGTVIGIARPTGIQYIDTSRFGKEIWFSSLLTWRSKLALCRLVLDVLRARRHLRDHDLSAAADLDTETAAEYAYRRLDAQLFDDLLDLQLRIGMGTPGKFLSKVDLFKMFDLNLRNQGRTRSFPLGLEQYAQALASHLTVHLRTTVNEVVESPSAVTVAYTNESGEAKTVQADACIVTTDAPSTAKLLPQLSLENRNFLHGIKYTVMTNLHAALKTRPDIPAFYVLVPKSVHPNLLGIVFEHHRAPKSVPPGRGFMSVYPAPEMSRELYDLDDAEAIHRVLEAVETILPGTRQNIDFSFINRWPRVVPSSRPGVYRQLRDFKASLPNWKRIHLAGDYFTLSGMNFAALRGERAADHALRLREPSRA